MKNHCHFPSWTFFYYSIYKKKQNKKKKHKIDKNNKIKMKMALENIKIKTNKKYYEILQHYINDPKITQGRTSTNLERGAFRCPHMVLITAEKSIGRSFRSPPKTHTCYKTH